MNPIKHFLSVCDVCICVARAAYEPETVGYVFAWVDLSLKNVGTEEVSTNTLYAYLKDTENYFYKREGVLSPKAFRLIDLPPGETIRGEIYWEVPSEAIIDEFIWHNHRSYISIIIPEFPDALLMPLFMIATLLAVILYRRKRTVKLHSFSNSRR